MDSSEDICPECGALLKRKSMFNEKVLQCTKCGYKYYIVYERKPDDENILEEKR